MMPRQLPQGLSSSSTGQEIHSSYDAPSAYSSFSPMGRASLQGTFSSPGQSFADLYHAAQQAAGQGGPGGLEMFDNESEVEGNFGQAEPIPEVPIGETSGEGGIGRSSSALTSEEGEGGQPPSSGYDEAGPVYDDAGNRIDPVTGERLDGGGEAQPASSTSSTGGGNKDDAFERYLNEHGYQVVTNAQGDYQIAGQGGRGESGQWHGHFGDPTDYTPQVQRLWRAFEEDWAKSQADQVQADRQKNLQNMFDLMPDAPEFDDAAVQQSIEAARQEMAIQQAIAMDAAMAGAARGRVGVGAQAGIQAQAGNQAAAQQGQLAADMNMKAQMLNFQSQLDHYKNQIGLLETMIATEADAETQRRLHAQRIEMLNRSSAIERQMMQMQIDAEERAQNFGFAGDIIGGLMGGGGALLGGSGGP